MAVLKWIFTAIAIVFGILGMANVVDYSMSLTVLRIFIGLAFLTKAGECHGKGAKRDTIIFAGLAIFIYAITAYDLIRKFI